MVAWIGRRTLSDRYGERDVKECHGPCSVLPEDS